MDFKKYEEAGRILDKVLKEAKRSIKDGDSLLEIAERLEGVILKEGGKPAFPCNLSIDNQAAHYTPGPGDQSRARGVLKVDCGVHVDGYIGDAAITLDLSGEHGKLVEAAEEALQNAISVIKDGVEVREVGRVIQETAKKYGYKPVENLGGHSIERYELHSGLFVPNISKGSGTLREGMVVAVEPFISEGVGRVSDSPPVEIFSLTGRRSRSPRAEKVRELLEKEYRRLPFARRWISKRLGNATQWLKFLLIDGSITGYPVLVDRGGVVAQAESTLLVEKDGAKVLAGKRDI